MPPLTKVWHSQVFSGQRSQGKDAQQEGVGWGSQLLSSGWCEPLLIPRLRGWRTSGGCQKAALGRALSTGHTVAFPLCPRPQALWTVIVSAEEVKNLCGHGLLSWSSRDMGAGQP